MSCDYNNFVRALTSLISFESLFCEEEENGPELNIDSPRHAKTRAHRIQGLLYIQRSRDSRIVLLMLLCLLNLRSYTVVKFLTHRLCP